MGTIDGCYQEGKLVSLKAFGSITNNSVELLGLFLRVCESKAVWKKLLAP
jgi:hypothetical protein